ncbi:MAG: helix-turn-helix domain-containing GNAT family N-acetyltransferase [Phenylobacterium sp.]
MIVDAIAAVRRFNRAYTPAIGVLDRGYLGGPYTVAESRVLYELAQGQGVTPKAVRTTLGLDAGYLSRIVTRLERDGLVERRRSADDGRSILLNLTDAGRTHFNALDARSAAQVETLLGGLSPPDRERLAGALDTARGLLEPGAAPQPVVLRAHESGDMGWVVERHGVLYGREYGWPRLEAVTCRIVADFLDNFDPERERCWIAARGVERLGSVFLVDDGEGVSRLRLLLLEPSARGMGLGRRLVDECLAFARSVGYREMVLWTHEELTAARAIYRTAGFQLEESHVHDDFGKPAVSETWRLVL